MARFIPLFLLILSLPFSNATAQTQDVAAGTYADVKAFLLKLAMEHPQNARTFELGTADNGEVIVGLAAGNGPVKNLVVATHHGNEYGSTEVAKAFAQAVAESPVIGQTIYVIPVLNIPGYNARRRWESAGGMSYDPNRDYPGPCGSAGPFNLRSTAALASFIDREGIVASATLHTYYPAIVYPWGFSTKDLSTPYDALFIELGKLATQESHYTVGNSAEVIYPADGTFEDYAFWKHGIWSFLFELGHSHSPSDAAIKEMIRVNVPGLRRFLEQAPTERAERHEFTGKCDTSLRVLDMHDE